MGFTTTPEVCGGDGLKVSPMGVERFACCPLVGDVFAARRTLSHVGFDLRPRIRR
jgi:hypothetical protein